MAPLPKRRHSTRRSGKRTASIHLGLPSTMTCSNCGVPRLSHTVCAACGFYNGKAVIIKKAVKKAVTK